MYLTHNKRQCAGANTRERDTFCNGPKQQVLTTGASKQDLWHAERARDSSGSPDRAQPREDFERIARPGALKQKHL